MNTKLDPNMTRWNMVLPSSVIQTFKAQAKQRGVSASTLMRQVLVAYMRKQEPLDAAK